MSLLVLIDPPDRRAWRHDEVFRGVLRVPDLYRARRVTPDPGGPGDEEGYCHHGSQGAPQEPPEARAGGTCAFLCEPRTPVHAPCQRLDTPDVPRPQKELLRAHGRGRLSSEGARGDSGPAGLVQSGLVSRWPRVAGCPAREFRGG